MINNVDSTFYSHKGICNFREQEERGVFPREKIGAPVDAPCME